MMRPIAFCLLVLSTMTAGATDWSSCSSDLRRVQRAARDAADGADALENKWQEVESKRRTSDDATERLTRCRRYPDSYDTYSDNCETLRRRARDAKSEFDATRNEYENDVKQFQSEIDDLHTYVKRSESSCAADESGGAANPAIICASLKQMKGQYPDSELLAACKMRLPEAMCRSCLGLQ